MLMIFFTTVLLVLMSATSSAFVSNATPQRQTPTLLHSSFSNDLDLYIYSIDGPLASMTEYKSKIAIKAAIEVWPSLLSVVDELGMKPFDDDDASNDDYSWLIQKLGALSSITQQGDSPDEMLGCDEVLLARMMLEDCLMRVGLVDEEASMEESFIQGKVLALALEISQKLVVDL